ncbi:uncharacterized protein LOC113146849 [Cyclospora cayetanensis]|uniref:Uncharacterized protein LOC113146849 n=1 Tax=Cyclospora cayetanensis TaxID=88456 RepID=A0A6P6RVS5_9EIME|nr:uncharacterized protein LOC113146849 [Cyclospora cayetanensis]
METPSQCSSSSSVSAEAIEFDLRDGGLFASLLACTAPSNTLNWEGGAGGGRNNSSSSNVEEVADWQCLRVTFGREGLLLRGVSKGREVYGELVLPVSFFEAFEYQKSQQQQPQRQEEGESVLVPLKSFVNALLLFGESARMRLRYAFGDGMLLLLLQQQQQLQPQLLREVLQELLLVEEDATARVTVEWHPPSPTGLQSSTRLLDVHTAPRSDNSDAAT